MRQQKYDHYKFSRAQMARCVCNDCGVNVIKRGDYCMINPQIWEDQFRLGWSDNLCIACIEARLGRQLTLLDFCCFPSVEGYPASEVLISRFAGTGTKAEAAQESIQAQSTRRSRRSRPSHRI